MSNKNIAAVAELVRQFAEQGMAGPAAVWQHFQVLCETPRPSKHEGALRDKIQVWAASRGFACTVDGAGNLIIRKGASPGCEGAPGVLLQGHLDMVCQANHGVAHDFSRDPIQTILREGWLVAEQTTLGADNGIGVALALGVLEMPDLVHGPLEVLLTVDEESGMGGARGLEGDALRASLMLNLDTEEWGRFYVGCAGGFDVDVSLRLAREPMPEGHVPLPLKIDGLRGGHSGLDIHLGRGNANKLLIRCLREMEASWPIRIVSLSGGTARNAIPREAGAVIAVPIAAKSQLCDQVSVLVNRLRAEFAETDAGIDVRVDANESMDATFPPSDRRVPDVLASESQSALLSVLHAAPVGVRCMSDHFPGVVETSNNLGVLCVDERGLSANLLVRSLVDSAGQALGEEIARLFASAGCDVALNGSYPGWQPNPQSKLLVTCLDIFNRDFGQQFGPGKIEVIHAGLECGLIAGKYPRLDMISFGPTIRGAHAPGERVDVASVTQCWNLLVGVLEAIAHAAPSVT